MGQRFLELNTAFSSTWANGLKQRKEATEVAFLAAVNYGGINWQPFGQRHIPSILLGQHKIPSTFRQGSGVFTF